MNYTLKTPILYLLFFVSTLFSFQQLVSQNYTLSKSSVLSVEGTSSLHDWELNAEEQSGNLNVSNSEEFTINKLDFSVKAESLKSGKSAMDKKTFKALNTDKHKKITFLMSSVSQLEKISESHFKATVKGKLTISGTTKSVSLSFNLKIDGDKIYLNGEKSLKMTDYGVEPPKALLGTIKTGDEIKIIFKSVFNK
ncbi:YceI family protein [Winogradskyella marincola]|uniref:YceI family protein n=1 Tax=Winogradskyella marincola TaxID=3037795 RepID=A0ABT6G2J6_9FLAO|nr:YceI family protein [Winogradskyella sp. YYF002]MDG4716270.1 YceI family protein [Winogradskyella sp. YYF002]